MARNKYDVDEILEDKFDVNQLKRLAGYLKPHRKQMTVVLFLMLSASALGMLIPRFVMQVMDVCIPAGWSAVKRRPYHGDCALHLCQSAD